MGRGKSCNLLIKLEVNCNSLSSEGCCHSVQNSLTWLPRRKIVDFHKDIPNTYHRAKSLQVYFWNTVTIYVNSIAFPIVRYPIPVQIQA
jgi:hypothetical protein